MHSPSPCAKTINFELQCPIVIPQTLRFILKNSDQNDKGERLIDKGERLIDKGERLIDKGERLIDKGERLIDKGERPID
jgi:hypothetical protein